MTRDEMHLDAMLRHLGAAYYDSLHGRAAKTDVTRSDDRPGRGTCDEAAATAPTRSGRRQPAPATLTGSSRLSSAW
jgi:hypothetical protein